MPRLPRGAGQCHSVKVLPKSLLVKGRAKGLASLTKPHCYHLRLLLGKYLTSGSSEIGGEIIALNRRRHDPSLLLRDTSYLILSSESPALSEPTAGRRSRRQRRPPRPRPATGAIRPPNPADQLLNPDGLGRRTPPEPVQTDFAEPTGRRPDPAGPGCPDRTPGPRRCPGPEPAFVPSAAGTAGRLWKWGPPAGARGAGAGAGAGSSFTGVPLAIFFKRFW